MMGEYVFRDATGFGFDCDADVELAYGTNLTVREYYAQNNTDHFGTIHEEIVRCRDYIYYQEDPDPIDPGWPMMCERTGDDMLMPNEYCSRGERQ